MIPQNRRIVKWEIRRLPYKGGIGRAILPPVLPFMVCTQLPAHGHCFYVHGLLTMFTHPVTGCTGSATGKIAVYLQFVCGMLPIFLQIRAVLFTIPCGARRGDFRRADSEVRRGLPAFVNVYKNEALFSTFRQFEQIASRRSGKAGRGGRKGAEGRMILHWCITLFAVIKRPAGAVPAPACERRNRARRVEVPRRRTLLFSLLQNSPDCAILPQEKPKPKGQKIWE